MPRAPVEIPEYYRDEVQNAARYFGMDPYLLAGLLGWESDWNPTAGSSAGARGLAQLMPGTAQGLGVTDPTNATQSIWGGARYLAQQLQGAGGNVAEAIARYHDGPGAGPNPTNWSTGARQEAAGVQQFMQSYQDRGQLGPATSPSGFSLGLPNPFDPNNPIHRLIFPNQDGGGGSPVSLPGLPDVGGAISGALQNVINQQVNGLKNRGAGLLVGSIGIVLVLLGLLALALKTGVPQEVAKTAMVA